ncbi:hypothetical protein jhhlp_005575 [Lomentospora prolificans]|uniref:6-phosphofructo-2-kinase domain-containing protein n=1 Tax=Lomentospora prolificans TaxID=41688 RepID=A0A2N3N3H3_9PEZI|nr:hypothetical protein jhhlp_005575 [Lomentospora prolificans]
MTGKVATGFSPSQSPIRYQPDNYHDLDAHPLPRGTDIILPAPAMPQPSAMPTPPKAIQDGHGHGPYAHLFDHHGPHIEPFPPYSTSHPSTAPGSPKMFLERSNSGHTPRIRPHATTLNIPGMTRSRASPDGRIPDRDVASKLVVVMVGLPARGKSYITKKIQRYLAWQQHNTEIFNVGNRRRVAAGKSTSTNPTEPSPATPAPSAPEQAAAILLNGVPAPLAEPTALNLDAPEAKSEKDEDKTDKDDFKDQSASFFNPKNESAAKVRDQLALNTLDELLDYLLRQGGSVGILDATNSTIHRRKLIVDHIKARESKLPILFIESVCTDKALLEANMRLKLSGPDYKDKDPLKSLEDFRKRVAAYESAYEPLGDYEENEDMQYIKMIDVGRKVIHYRLRGFLSTTIAGYLTAFNLSPRQIWITRHGQSEDNVKGKLGGDSPLTDRGRTFSRALYNFITYQRRAWIVEQQDNMASASFPPQPGDLTPPYPEYNREIDEKNFCIWTSMLQRSVDTAQLFEADDDYDVKNWEMLNEINAGQFEGKTYDEIARDYPEEYHKRTADKLHYIYPGVGGEGYLQVIHRMRDMVREMERITDHVLIIGHRSICRVLMAYFMNLTRGDITDLDVPLGMLYAIEPKPYGISFHAYRYNEQNGWFDEVPNYTPHRTDRYDGKD